LEQGRDQSDATPEIYALQQENREPWPEDIPHLRIDTEQPLDSQVAEVIARLQQIVAE
jgi:hypothetical protein